MWNTLTWYRLRDPEIAADVDTLRDETLRFFLKATVVGYVAWHSVGAILSAPAERYRYWLLFVVVALGLLATYILQGKTARSASWCLLATAIVSITTATWLLASPSAPLLLPLVVMIAVVLLHPIAAVVSTTASVSLLLLLRHAGPLAFLGHDRVVEVAVLSILTIVAAWALGRNMVVAVEWSLHHYRYARQNAEEARVHRAKSVQALKQLDHAYYRLQQSNAALVTAWKAAEAAERSKSEFVTNISHELRTPLNLIAGFSEMVLTSPESYGVPLPAPYRADLMAVYRSAQHLLTLANDVIDLARVGMGRLALIREPVDLRQIIGDACDIVQDYIAAKGLTLLAEIPCDLPPLHVDRLRVRQVVLNLLTNAARFTERGRITISAALEADSVVVRVSDTGRGIAPADLPRVFEEFHHDDVDPATDPSGLGGIGLGLPISKRFVELHGGQMGVSSVLGEGTTFWFTLPVAVVECGVTGNAWRPLRAIDGGTGCERVVVLAGSDRRNAVFLQRHLRGYRVLAASSIARARAIANEFHAVAILADPDCAEPVDDGECPAPLLRLPLPLGARLASSLGVSDYLVKPVTRSDVQALVARAEKPVNSVLIVDDDRRFVHLLTRMLRSILPSHSHILSAYTDTDALAILNHTRPDLLLVDLVVPERGGFDLIAALRARPDLADVNVAIVSAQDQIASQVALHGQLSVERSDGFRLEELLGLIESIVGTLDPPRPRVRSPLTNATAQ